MADCIPGAKKPLLLDDAEDLCMTCVAEGHHVKATAICKDCDEFLCNECNTVHTKPLKMKHHLIVAIGNAENNNCTEECTIHQGRYIEYFCTIHEQLGCAVCNFITHKTCENVVYIPDASLEDTTESLVLRQLSENIKTLNENVSYNRDRIKTNFLISSEIKQDATTQNADLIREITLLVEKKKAELDSEADAKYDEDSKKLEELGEMCTDVEAELAEVSSNLDKDENKTGEQCQLYIKMKRAKTKAALIEERIKDIEKMNQVHRYTYKPNAKLVDVRDTLENTGQLVDCHPQKALVKYMYTIDITSDLDEATTDCCISGLAIVSKKYIVAVETTNKSANLIDMTSNKTEHRLNLQSQSRDVSRISDDEIVITLPEKKKLQFLAISSEGQLTRGRELAVGGQCYGIVYHEEQLIVSFIPSLFLQTSKIKILDMDGKELKTLTQQHTGSPGYLALSYDRSSLYVSNWGNSSVKRMSLDGEVLAAYNSGDLKMPHGVACARDGTVFVCGRQTNNIHQLSDNGELIQVLLNANSGMSEPCCIAVKEGKERKLFIGTGNRIKVFSII